MNLFNEVLIGRHGSSQCECSGCEDILETIDHPTRRIRRCPFYITHLDKGVRRIVQDGHRLNTGGRIHCVNIFEINAGIAIAKYATETIIGETFENKKLGRGLGRGDLIGGHFNVHPGKNLTACGVHFSHSEKGAAFVLVR